MSIVRLWSSRLDDWEELQPTQIPWHEGVLSVQGFLGIIAEIKAGKGTIANIIARAVARHNGRTQLINFSDAITECLMPLTHITLDRDAKQKMAMCVINGWDDAVWAKEVDHRARQSTADFLVLAGMRRPPELPLVRALGDPAPELPLMSGSRRLVYPFTPQPARPKLSRVLYLTAPAEKRWQWLREKNELPGDAEKTWEQFQIEDRAPSEVRIREVGPSADFHYHNDGTKQQLEDFVHTLLRDHYGIDV
jgi:hypothetical protein